MLPIQTNLPPLYKHTNKHHLNFTFSKNLTNNLGKYKRALLSMHKVQVTSKNI